MNVNYFERNVTCILHEIMLQTSLEVKQDLQNAQLLVIKNPKWGISLIDISDGNGNSGDVLDTLVL